MDFRIYRWKRTIISLPWHRTLFPIPIVDPLIDVLLVEPREFFTSFFIKFKAYNRSRISRIFKKANVAIQMDPIELAFLTSNSLLDVCVSFPLTIILQEMTSARIQK